MKQLSLTLACIFLLCSAYAQDTPVSPDTVAVSSGTPTAVVAPDSIPAAAAPAVTAPDSTKSKRDNKKVQITGIPTLGLDRSQGLTLGATGMMFFPIGKKPDTPPSAVMLHGEWSTNKSWMAFAFGQLYLFDDFLRVFVGAGYLDNNFQTFQNIGDGTLAEIPFESKGPVFFLSPLFKVYKKLYIGPSVQLAKLKVTFDLPDGSTSQETDNANALGAALVYDSKDNQYNPSNGLTAAIRYVNVPGWMGNDSIYNKITMIGNYYWRIDRSKVLASRLFANVGLGTVPFSGQTYVGNNDLRGYTKGEYRGNQVYAIQSEFRWNFYRKWGMVGFFGLAMTVDPTSQVLPAGGGGIRYKVVPKYNINAGIDAAVGKDDWGIYFRITEAF